MNLTSREFALAVALALLGLAFSTRQWLMFLNGLTPFAGLVVYYVVLFVCLYVLSRMDLVVFGFKIKDPLQTIGLILITFAFFICVDWESPYVQIVTVGYGAEHVSPVLFQAEDGAVWSLWQSAVPAADIETLRILTYGVTPFILAFIGGFLVSGKVKFGW